MTTLLCGHVSYDLTKDSDWHSLVGVRDRLEMLDRRNLVSPSQPISLQRRHFPYIEKSSYIDCCTTPAFRLRRPQDRQQ